MFIEKVTDSIERNLNRVYCPIYRKIYLRKDICRVREKEVINVVFLLWGYSSWKSEGLYLQMLQHPRFNPILAITLCRDLIEKERLERFLQSRHYPYTDLDSNSLKKISPDIIFYQRPYMTEIPFHLSPMFYPQALTCQVHYAFHSLREKWTVRTRLLDIAWQSYYENQRTRDEYLDLVRYKQSLVVTGVPFQDRLNKPKIEFVNPWKDKKKRKHIIYAPHHTIEGSQYGKGLDYSTFLWYNEFMLELAEKYNDSIYIAFKPHPFLYEKLIKFWGKERTDAYFRRWASLENVQIEQDEYMGLLKHSDAMIHDCCSFTIEYMYMHNPCLYLERNPHHTDNQTELARRSYELHEHAYNKEDIEQFILRVIGGVDINKEAREQFYQESLVLPNGQSACQNIISAILGDAKHG